MAKNAGKKRKTRDNDEEEEQSTVITSESLKAEFEELKSKCNATVASTVASMNANVASTVATMNANLSSMNATAAAMTNTLTSMASSLTNKVEARIALLSESEKTVCEKEKRWSDLETKIETSLVQAQNCQINLNIGGRLFTASKNTLMSMKGTYFYAMLSFPERYKPGADGSYFIERDPECFQRILNYLRNGKLIIKDLSEYQIDLLKDDFDYYSMDLPEELLPPPPVVVVVCSWDENRKSTKATLSNNNFTVTKTSGGVSWNCRVIGSQAVDKYTVRIGDKCIMIGFRNGDEMFWLLNLRSGKLNFKNGANQINGEPYTTKIFATGDYVTVIREGTTIRFQKNKVDLGVCTPFTNIPDQPLLPIACIKSENICFTLVHDY